MGSHYWILLENIDKVKECMQAIKETLAKYGIKTIFVYDDISMHTYTYDNGDTDTYIVCKNADGEKMMVILIIQKTLVILLSQPYLMKKTFELFV